MRTMIRFILKHILKILFRVEVTGLEHYEAAGERVLIVANHQSFLDAMLIALFMPVQPFFAINSAVADRWYIKPFLVLAKTFPLDPTNPMATKTMINRLKAGGHCVIFPEGRITVTGALMKIYEGPGLIADKSDAQVLPVRIEGAQYTPLSRLGKKVRLRWLPQISLHILPPRKFEIPEEIKGRARRAAISTKLYDVMVNMIFETSNIDQTLWHGVCEAEHIHGSDHIIVDDINRTPLTYRQLITRSLILGEKIAENTKHGEIVGFLLPNMANSVVTFMAMQAYGRVPAMLNFSAGVKNICSACKTTDLKHIYTSRKFIETAKLEAVIDAVRDQGVKVHFLEDVAKTITLQDKLKGLAKAILNKHQDDEQPAADAPAVVLFTSGSEGVPKGVVLSHKNIQANRYQLSATVDFTASDIAFNALPIFHSFGLTGGTLLPILSGIRTFFYPSPLHYRIVPELVYDTNATLMFGTDTFLSGYARFANAYDFYAVRYVFAGAEKLKEETRKLWSEKYGVRVLEGYGATETAPAISTNSAMKNKAGTVGRFMPGMDYLLEPVQGIDAENTGRLLVKGANVMKGYMFEHTPATIEAPHYESELISTTPAPNGWYDTGDIVHVDSEGFITIQGRAKRFAKIGGEMVSLTAVESALSQLWKDAAHAVVAMPDAKKGEQLVLLTEQKDAEVKAIVAAFKAEGISELSVPKTIFHVDSLPLLGTGKVDYTRVRKVVEERM